jgi:hypothetical protein
MERIEKGIRPTPYVLIETVMGWRVFGGRNVSQMEVLYQDVRADGTYYADGSVLAGYGGLQPLSFDARVISFGNIGRNLKPKTQDLLIGYTGKQKATLSISFDNTDGYFNDMMRIEPILNQTMAVKLGYADDPFDYHISLFTGLINNVRFDSKGRFIIDAVEALTDFTEYHYLDRAGRFDNPLNTNDRLPIIYGDLSDGPNWRAPCIDTVNYVYCYAGHVVLSEAAGNDVRVFVNGLEINPVDYTFNHADPSYEYMATITFNSSAEGDLEQIDVVVGGMGKEDVGDGSGTLIENIIDIIEDLLTNVVGWGGELESTKKAVSYHLFESKAYIAAGAIVEDVDIWSILVEMSSSFLGIIYQNPSDKLVIDLDLRKWTDKRFFESNAVITTPHTEIYSANQALDSVANAMPASFAYDYYNKEYRHHTDVSTFHDELSQQVYGVRSPTPYQFKWVRDLATVQSMQDILVDRLGRPIWQLKIKDISGFNLFVELGDIVQFSARGYYEADGVELINQFFVVHGFNLDLDTLKVEWYVIDTKNCKTIPKLADGTYYADGSITAGNDRDSNIY